MSDLIVEVVKIDEIKKHSNADKLEIAIIKGWQCVIQKGQFNVGDRVIYIPPDAMLTNELAEEIGVSKYLGKHGRVKSVRLRGEPSFGLIIKNKWGFNGTEDLKEKLKIEKYDPGEAIIDQVKVPKGLLGWIRHYINLFLHNVLHIKGHNLTLGDHPLFHKYTDIQNIKNYKDVFQEGEGVVVTEKIHGTNSRVGAIATKTHSFFSKKEKIDIEFLVGSHNKRRRIHPGDVYSIPLTTKVKQLLRFLINKYNAQSVILFGEIYGGQDLKYGLSGYSKFKAFDISVDGEYLNYKEFKRICEVSDIETVPEIYYGPFDYELIKEIVSGNTTLMGKNPHLMEGGVIKPVEEGTYKRGRKVLKMINDNYLLRKKGTEFH